jgi:alcohol dehydrogenase class IV
MSFDPKSVFGTWQYPTTIRFGIGRIKELPKVCKKDLGISRPLLVTDPGLAGLPMISDMVEMLKGEGITVTVFSDVQGNPTGSNVEAGCKVYRENDCDGTILVGGGSAMDCGKVIAMSVRQTQPWKTYAIVKGGEQNAIESDKIDPMIAIPTTAGTGSEVGRAAVITDEETHVKQILLHNSMLPAVVIADPELTAGLPANLTAGTGMDALTHCIEAYCVPVYHPMSDGIAIEGLRLIKDYLPRAVDDGSDLEARAHMMAAASMGAVAFSKGLGAVHAMAHPVGAHYNTHHGLTNAVILPYVLNYNREAITEKLERLAPFLGLEPSYQAVWDWIDGYRARFGMPKTLAELGVEEDLLDTLSEEGAADLAARTNPVRVGAKELRQIYDNAMAGA